ncbi:MAG: hypothetical protein E3J86_02555 [Candidatus Thorarchaeota archaeon]|nr:MAG: hypothetical protein E3J86_02555 [Candidatus Thorarchaeota archaeon]
MARSKGVTISVKVPINWEVMTERTKQRLRQIVGRDTRVIRAYLGIIEQNENDLLTGKNRDNIDDTKLSKMTMTSQKVKSGYSQRSCVPHDFKIRFPRISQNEMAECRQTAVALYESYLKLKRNGRTVSRPTSISCVRRIPRWSFVDRTFRMVKNRTTVPTWWLDLRDSLDSVQEGRIHHDRLIIPLKMSPYHLNQMRKGETKAVKLYVDRSRKWWVTFAVRITTFQVQNENLPVAILGIDLGIEKAACSTILTPEKTRETRYFVQREKVKLIKKYDGLVSDLQREMNTRRNNNLSFDRIAERLRRMRSKRENIAREYDRVLVRKILDYISELSKKFTLYVAIGRLKNIRMLARRGNYRGRKFRGMIHS